MALSTKAINRRIKSVKNTKKITKAMEMVAAAKMRKSVEAALQTRTYAQLAWELLVNISQKEKHTVPLLTARPVSKMLVVLITSNRGLCGSFNAGIIKKLAKQLQDPQHIARHKGDEENTEVAEENITIDLISIGKKGAEFAKREGYNLVAAFTDLPDTPSLADILPVTTLCIGAYQKEEYDKVVVAYTDYKSVVVQNPKLRQVLPVSEHDLEDMIHDLGKHGDGGKVKSEKVVAQNMSEYLFEPSKTEVLTEILPHLVETQVLQALLESSASEHSARMMAMRNASESATDMIAELTLRFNKARQAGITQEIAEISSGAAALE